MAEPMPGSYLTFQLGRQYFAVESRKVRAVVARRDANMPVVDVRARLGLPRNTNGGAAWALVLGVHNRAVGIEADSLSEILDVRERDIRNGVIQLRLNGRPYGRPKTLFDPDRLFSAEELDTLDDYES